MRAGETTKLPVDQWLPSAVVDVPHDEIAAMNLVLQRVENDCGICPDSDGDAVVWCLLDLGYEVVRRVTPVKQKSNGTTANWSGKTARHR